MDQTNVINNEINDSDSEVKVLNIVEFSPTPESLKLRVFPMNPKRAASILQEEGYRALIDTYNDYQFVISSSDGWEFKICFYDDIGDEDNNDQNSFRMYSGYKINFEDRETFIQAANQINMKYRYIRAYISGDENYAFTEVDMHHMCVDGISDNGFMAVISRFLYLRNIYREQYHECLKNLAEIKS